MSQNGIDVLIVFLLSLLRLDNKKVNVTVTEKAAREEKILSTYWSEKQIKFAVKKLLSFGFIHSSCIYIIWKK